MSSDDAPLIAVGMLKVIIIALYVELRLDRPHMAPGGIAFFRLDFDDVGSEISQPHSCNRSLLKCGNLYDLYSR